MTCHVQQASNDLLATLSSLLSTFQSNLVDVSGQLNQLQSASTAIDTRLARRQALATPLASLVDAIAIPPDLIHVIRNTTPSAAWIPVIETLDAKILAVRSRGKVKAAHQVGMVVEGLKAHAVVSIRAFLLALIRPLRATVETNIQSVQFDSLLKYTTLFTFLSRHAPRAAEEVQRAYVVSARAYYETTFRRYTRSLATIKARTSKNASSTDAEHESSNTSAIVQRLEYAHIDSTGGPVMLGHQSEDKSFCPPVEAIFRSILLVVLDNASAEFTFIVKFFGPSVDAPTNAQRAATAVSTPNPRDKQLGFLDRTHSMTSIHSTGADSTAPPASSTGKTDYAVDTFAAEGAPPSSTTAQGSSFPTNSTLRQLEPIFTSTMSSALEYVQDLITTSLLDSFASVMTASSSLTSSMSSVPPPLQPTLALLTMIRTTDHAMTEAGQRGCTPIEPFLHVVLQSIWPIFQKNLDAHVESVKRLADQAEAAAGRGPTSSFASGRALVAGMASMLASGGGKLSDETVRRTCRRYAELVLFIVVLSPDEDELMVWNS